MNRPVRASIPLCVQMRGGNKALSRVQNMSQHLFQTFSVTADLLGITVDSGKAYRWYGTHKTSLEVLIIPIKEHGDEALSPSYLFLCAYFTQVWCNVYETSNHMWWIYAVCVHFPILCLFFQIIGTIPLMPNPVPSSQAAGGAQGLQVQPITPQLLTNAQGQIIATVIGNQILPVINTQGITLSPLKPGQQVKCL